MSDTSMTRAQIEDLARAHFNRLMDEQEARLGSSSAWDRRDEHDDDLDSHLDVLGSLLSDCREALANNDFRHVRSEIAAILSGVDPRHPKGGAYRDLERAILRAEIEALRIEMARTAGDYTVQPQDPLFRALRAESVRAEPVARSSPILSQILETYVEAQGEDGKWTPITKKNTVNKLRLFVEAVGPKPIDDVTRDDIRGWRDFLTDQELSNNTVRQHFKAVAAMFNWAKQERKATIDNPTKGLAPPPDDPKRDAFTANDLERLFHSPLYTGHWRADRRDRPGDVLVKDFKYWFPLIGLHTGMRVEEIARLRTEDVRVEDGVWCFDIRKSKTKAGERLVPLHPRLTALGFLDHVKALAPGQLWPELSPNSEGSYSARFVQWFIEYRRLIGLDREGLVFHSFRHTFVSRLEEAGVDTNSIGRIVGHKIKGITAGTYAGKFFTPAKRLETLKDLDFGVDLGHLLGDGS